MLFFCQIYIAILIILIGLHNSEHLHENGIFLVSVRDRVRHFEQVKIGDYVTGLEQQCLYFWFAYTWVVT